MDEPRSDESLQKPSLTIWLVAALLLLIVALVGFSLFGPNPPIEIGPATTRITTPLDANGLPDYAAVLLADSRKGVTPENNGAVPFLMAMWPEEGSSDEYSPEEAKLICEELGLPGIPPIEDRVTSLYSDKVRLGALRLLRERLPKPEGFSQTEVEALDPTDESLWGMMDASGGMSYEEFLTGPPADAMKDSRVHEMINLCQPAGRPWTAKDLPFLAEWLEENSTALDRLVEAAERPEWHAPSPGLLQGGSVRLVETWHSTVPQQLRKTARFLTTRSHFHQGKGDYGKAIRDAMTILRLADISKNGPFLAEQLVASSIGGVGLETLNQIVTDKATPAATLRTLLGEFDQLGSFSRFAHSADRGERFSALDAAVASDYSAVDPDGFSMPNWISCDWNLTLKALNDHYDAIVAASKLPTWAQRQAAYEQIDAMTETVSFPPSTTRELLGLLTARGRGKMVGNLWVNQWGGNVALQYWIEDRYTIDRQLTRLSIALAIHRAEKGVYPESLEELILGVLPKLPVDLFHKNPFAYRKTGDGYLLYSLGPNGTDEGGSNRGQASSPKLEGFFVELVDEYYDESAWDENGEYVGESRMSANEELDDPYSKIPLEADDLSLRVPLPEPEPWPWERKK